MVEGQPFQTGLQVIRAHLGIVGIVGRVRACLVGDSSLLGQMVLGPRHATAFRTFGDRAIVTGNMPHRLPDAIGQGTGSNDCR